MEELRTLQSYRADKHLTQKKVADMVKINVATYQRYEAFEALPNIKKADEIAAALGTRKECIKWYDD